MPPETCHATKSVQVARYIFKTTHRGIVRVDYRRLAAGNIQLGKVPGTSAISAVDNQISATRLDGDTGLAAGEVDVAGKMCKHQ